MKKRENEELDKWNEKRRIEEKKRDHETKDRKGNELVVIGK